MASLYPYEPVTRLAKAVEALDRQYDELRSAAAGRLGELYNPADYPPSLAGLFTVEWDFPSVEPPDYLLQLNPALYEQERQRIAGQFEQAFTEEFAKLVGHVTERLSGLGEDGRPKTFRDSAVTKLREFFERFRTLNIHSSQQQIPKAGSVIEVRYLYAYPGGSLFQPVCLSQRDDLVGDEQYEQSRWFIWHNNQWVQAPANQNEELQLLNQQAKTLREKLGCSQPDEVSYCRTWKCPDCGRTIEHSYEALAEVGTLICTAHLVRRRAVALRHSVANH